MPYCRDELMEQDLALLRASVDYVYICSGDPQSFTEAEANRLASKAINSWSFSGPSAGVVDGRKITLIEFTTDIDADGEGQIMAFVNTEESQLWLSFPRTFPKALEVGDSITIPATEIEAGFPTIII